MKTKNINVKLRDGETSAYLAIPDRQTSGRIQPWEQRARIVLHDCLHLGGREAGVAHRADRIEIGRRE